MHETKGKSAQTRTDAEWRAELTPEQYRVLRQKGTERAFTGELWDEHRAGHLPLRRLRRRAVPLRDEVRVRAPAGRASSPRPTSDAVATETDRSFFMTRTEAMCATCGGHLGHVFDDGPNPTGLRYCINSASLKLDPEAEPHG